jgi:hypothetical protein
MSKEITQTVDDIKKTESANLPITQIVDDIKKTELTDLPNDDAKNAFMNAMLYVMLNQ